MSVPLRDKGKWGLAGMQRAQGTSGVASKRRRGPDRGVVALTVAMKTDALPKDALCIVTLAEEAVEKQRNKNKRKWGSKGDNESGEGREQLTKNVLEHTAKGTRQHGDRARRQISACERVCADLRSGLRTLNL